MGLTRRQFLKALGASTAGAGALAIAGCGVDQRELQVQSPVRLPEDKLQGTDYYYATSCGLCASGCGLTTRIIEGRAKKLEGNADHPVNRGKTCSWGQAGVQALYHPDRIAGPLRRDGERGRGQFKSISWNEGLKELQARVAGAGGGGLVIATSPAWDHNWYVARRFSEALKGRHLTFEVFEDTALLAAMSRIYQQDLIPDFNLGSAQFILSFGADFLGTWLSPVQYSRVFGEFRRGSKRKRGTLVQVEPRLSMTGASADEWIPVRPGSEGVLALSLAQSMIADGLVDGQAVDAFLGKTQQGALDSYRPEQAERVTGISAQRIRQLARRFATEQPSIAIAGGSAGAHTNGVFNLSMAYGLNRLASGAGAPGGVRFNPLPPLDGISKAPQATSFADWTKEADRMRKGQVQLLMVQGTNPVYGLPASVNLGQAVAKVPYIVSFASVMDETAEQADLVLPENTFLEAWGFSVPNPGPGFPVVTVQQPAVVPLHDTRSFTDVLLALAQALGGGVQKSLPWPSSRDLLQAQAEQLLARGGGSVPETDPQRFWVGTLQRGGWWDEKALAGNQVKGGAAPLEAIRPATPEFAGSDRDYPFHFLPFSSVALRDGSMAHLPWLQATPDPTTTIVWQTWLEINPRTAASMGLKEGDIVAVESPHGRLEVPVYPYPGIGPDVVAMPAGQGHTSGGRYAKGRGVNPMDLVAPLTERETGALAWAATRVRLAKTGRSVQISKYEGAVPAVVPAGAEILGTVREKAGGA